jgi:hypothetical protein
MALLDAIQGQLGQSGVDQISRQLGVNPGLAQAAISAALPMIVAGMARHASQPDGAAAIQQAAETHQDVPDNIDSVLQAGPPADAGGGGLLGRILGQHHTTVQDGVERATGLDGDKSRKLLMMLSPIVLGMLARKHFGGGQQADAPQINNTLQQEAQAAQQEVQRHSPHVGGILGQIFGNL